MLSSRKRSGLAAALVAALGASAAAHAGVLLSRKEALARAFPEATRLEAVDLFPTKAHRLELSREARVPVDDPLLTVYRAEQGTRVLGWAIFDTRRQRTSTGTTVVALNPAGAVLSVRYCAFHEPQDYMPVPRWLAKLVGSRPGATLRVGDDLAAITGATLSARAAAAAVRRALAIHSVMLQPNPAGVE